MSQEPKNNEEGFMYKLASFIVDKRNLIFLIVAIGLVFSAFSRNWVQVENQLSAYLPKDSETYRGLHLMEDEFITFGTAKVMNARIYQSGDYVLYIIAGASYDGEDSEAENKLAVSEYAKIDETLKSVLGTLPENLAVVPEA